MTSAELYILNCRKWRDSYPRKRRKRLRKTLYPVFKCMIEIPPLHYR